MIRELSDGQMADIFTGSVLGIALSLGSALCLYGCLRGKVDPESVKIFGIPIFLIGILGYVLIIITTLFDGFQVINLALIVIAALFVPFLLYKSISIRLFCPFCVAAWITNVYLLVIRLAR